MCWLASPNCAAKRIGRRQLGPVRGARAPTASAAHSCRRCCCCLAIRAPPAPIHEVEAFGPVATVLPYSDTADAIALARRGEGSLAASVFSADDALAGQIVLGLAPYHGRILVVNRTCAKESTGHGSPLAPLIHGGPGRAGGGRGDGGHSRRAALHAAHRGAGFARYSRPRSAGAGCGAAGCAIPVGTRSASPSMSWNWATRCNRRSAK